MLTRRADLDGLYRDYNDPTLARFTRFWVTDDGWFVVFRETERSASWTDDAIESWVQRFRGTNPPKTLSLARVQDWKEQTDRAIARGHCASTTIK